MCVVKLRRGCDAAVLLEVSAGILDIARKDFSHLLIQMRANNDAQAVDLLGVGRHRISRQNPSSLPHFVRDVEFVIMFYGLGTLPPGSAVDMHRDGDSGLFFVLVRPVEDFLDFIAFAGEVLWRGWAKTNQTGMQDPNRLSGLAPRSLQTTRVTLPLAKTIPWRGKR